MRKIIKTFDKQKIFLATLLFLFSLIFFFIPSFSAIRPFNYVNLGLVGLFCALVLLYTLLYKKLVIDWFFVATLIFNLTVLVSNIVNRDATQTTTYLSLSIFAFFSYQLFLDEKIKTIMKFAMFASFMAFSFYFCFYYRTELLHFSNTRIGDHFDNLNTVGYYFLYGFVISLSFIKRKNPISWVTSVASFLFLFLLFRTGSRSALLIALIVFLIFFWLFLNGIKVFLKIIIFLSLVLTIVLAFVVLGKITNGALLERLIDFFNLFSSDSNTDYSTINRIELVFQSLSLFLRRPLFGWGNNVFSIYSSERLFAHNNITELLCDFGIFACLSFEFLLFKPVKSIIKKRHNDCLPLLLLFSVFLVQFFYVNSQLKYDWILISLIASSCIIQNNSISRAVFFEVNI